MRSYFIKRTFSSLMTLFIVITVTFFIFRLTPGSPFDTEKTWPPEIKLAIEQKYGLNQPLLTQFIEWIKDVLEGDFGYSFQYPDTRVSDIIIQQIPMSFTIGIFALILAWILAIVAALGSYQYRESWIDKVTTFISTMGVSLPLYLTATLLILFFSNYLKLLPPALYDDPTSLILPVIALSLKPFSLITRLLKVSLIEIENSFYIKTAFSKGLSKKKVLVKHFLKNAIISPWAMMGPMIASLLTGSFVIELIFQLPGIGYTFVSSVINRDYPLVIAITLIYGSILISANFISDLLLSKIDPRIQFS